MARLPVKPNTLRALFAKSGNRCAFPGCTHELVNSKNLFVAEVCHIEAVEPEGERYNSAQSDEDRRSFENLILLCHKHHVETDVVAEFPTDRMRELKAQHEATYGHNPFKVDESVIYRLESEMRSYWKTVEHANKVEHPVPELAVEIDTNASPMALLDALQTSASKLQEFSDWLGDSDCKLNDEIRSHLGKIGYDLTAYDAVPYYENPFFNRGWEIHNLGLPNTFTTLGVLLVQAEIRLLEEYLKTHHDDGVARLRLEKAKVELLELAKSAGYAD